MSSVSPNFPGTGLLIDTNLLVLFIVGSVNRNRIDNFKRTSKYSKEDFDLLLGVISGIGKPLYTVAHVLAEVSNLTVLHGQERLRAREVLKEMVAVLKEPEMASVRASGATEYPALGLVDAAIATVARENDCAVLTDDLDLYVSLMNQGISAFNFTHLQAREWRV